MLTFAFEPLKVIPPRAVPLTFWSIPPSTATPQAALRSALPRTSIAFVAFANARMQSAPLVVVWFTVTTERANRIGVVIGWTCPIWLAGRIDVCVDSHVPVFCVISTTIQVLLGSHTIGRGSRPRTGAQLLPLGVIRHVFATGIVNPFNDA